MKFGTLNRLDALGSVLSGPCAIHCLCMPVLVGVLPSLGLTLFVDRGAERVACAVMLVIAAACVWNGCRVHRRWSLLALLGVGTALVAFAQSIAPPDCCVAERGSWTEAAVMFTGGAMVASSHWLNLRFRRCACCAPTA